MITAIAPWFGCKRSMADIIVEQLGRHRYYLEPFCGGMAVLLAKEPTAHEVVCDLHGNLTTMAMVLASDRWQDLHERLQRTICSEALFKSCLADTMRPLQGPDSPSAVEDGHVDRAYSFFVTSWMQRNGVAGTQRHFYQVAVRWQPTGGSPARRFVSASSCIPEWHERLRNVQILNRDGFSVLAKMDDHPDVAIYVDPPYIHEGHRTGSCLYEHEFRLEDHRHLAALLDRFQRARVVVSYYEDPALATWYDPRRWKKLSCPREKLMFRQNKRGAGVRIAPEVLLINGPIVDGSAARPSGQ